VILPVFVVSRGVVIPTSGISSERIKNLLHRILRPEKEFRRLAPAGFAACILGRWSVGEKFVSTSICLGIGVKTGWMGAGRFRAHMADLRQVSLQWAGEAEFPLVLPYEQTDRKPCSATWRAISVSTNGAQPSMQILSEYFAAANDRFLDELEKVQSSETLTSMVQRWVVDERPWAQQQIVKYLQRELNFPGHEVIVKRFVRHFESARDHEMMARLMVTLDRLVRRKRSIDLPESCESRDTRETLRLFAKPNRTIVEKTGRTRVSGAGQWKRRLPLPDIHNRAENRLFGHRTRNYLRRRVWRYFRWLSFRDPQAYLIAISSALLQYRDSDFGSDENTLDNWSLMHACYFHSDAIQFRVAHANLVPGKLLGELTAAPWQPALWQLAEAADLLLQVLSDAESSRVRIWAIELLQQNHAKMILQLQVNRLLNLLRHSDPRVHQFALPNFLQHQQLSELDVSTWIELLESSHLKQQHEVFQAMTVHLPATDLDAGQLLQLTLAQCVPVAELGFQRLRQHHSEYPLSIEELTTLARARCDALAGELTTWALTQLGSEAISSAESIAGFFESPLESMRTAAVNWLENSPSPGRNDPRLWSMLVESPHQDVRLRVAEWLDNKSQQTQQTGTGLESMTHVSCSVILSVHQGSRTKLKAIAQIQSAILRSPEQAPEFLPVLAVAVRSPRAPERRRAIAAVATLMVHGDSSVRENLQRLLPEISLAE